MKIEISKKALRKDCKFDYVKSPCIVEASFSSLCGGIYIVSKAEMERVGAVTVTDRFFRLSEARRADSQAKKNHHSKPCQWGTYAAGALFGACVWFAFLYLWPVI